MNPKTTPTETPLRLTFRVHIEPVDKYRSVLAFGAGLEVSNTFTMQHLTFEQTVQIQRRFNELAETIGKEFAISQADLEEWEKAIEERRRPTALY